jgi:hypothetical protein
VAGAEVCGFGKPGSGFHDGLGEGAGLVDGRAGTIGSGGGVTAAAGDGALGGGGAGGCAAARAAYPAASNPAAMTSTMVIATAGRVQCLHAGRCAGVDPVVGLGRV